MRNNDIDMVILENIDIDIDIRENIDINIDMDMDKQISSLVNGHF